MLFYNFMLCNVFFKYYLVFIVISFILFFKRISIIFLINFLID